MITMSATNRKVETVTTMMGIDHVAMGKRTYGISVRTTALF
jgi:hypothetical protein